MRVLLLSFYYPPDIGPAPLRAKSLLDALMDVSDTKLEVVVLTTLPNRYHTHEASAPEFEQNGSVSVRRFTLPQHHSGMVDQARAFVTYARSVLGFAKDQQWDVVIATSSRLMTAVLGAWVSRKTKSKLYLDIRDLFTDTMEDVLTKNPLRILMPAFRLLERWTFRSAHQMNVVSAAFLPHVAEVAPAQKPTVFTNGIDEIFVDTDFSSQEKKDHSLVLYAGNMGQGQGLHHVIPGAASALKEEKIFFRLLGDGGERKTLQYSITNMNLANVEILDPVPRTKLIEQYKMADVLFLHLNDFKAFHKVLPSKIFEYAATGKPILAGVGGYAAKFLREQVPGVEVFNPCDIEAMNVGLQKLLNGPRMIKRSDFCSRYFRKNIMWNMAQDIRASTNIVYK